MKYHLKIVGKEDIMGRQSQTAVENGEKITALYCRLSRDDEMQGDSNSIRKPSSKNMPLTMGFGIASSSWMMGTAGRISTAPTGSDS